jgi:hypothetical protein
MRRVTIKRLPQSVSFENPFRAPSDFSGENPTCGIDPAGKIFHLDFPRGGIHHHENEERGGMPGTEKT